MEVEKKDLKKGDVIQESKEYLDQFQANKDEQKNESEEQVIKFTHKLHDKYGFLSNLFQSKIIIDNLQFMSVEHYYQAMKFEGTKKFEVIRRAGKAIDAHKLAQKKDTPKNRDWQDLKIAYMKKAIQAKFEQNKALKKQLIETYPNKLVDVTPGDKYWGIGDKEEGKNMNGQILMEIREMCMKEPKEEEMEQ
ncbi:hypothetical protein ABPG74_001880 [Tetrahymena malaccensis]